MSQPKQEKRRIPSIIYGILASLAILIALAIYAGRAPVRRLTPVSTHQQEAGQASTNETLLKGGVLQRNVPANTRPEEYIDVETGTDVPHFTTGDFTVHAGKIVSVTLRNNSKVGHTHDWVLVRPGTREEVQMLAKDIPPTWRGIPNTPDVLAFIPLLQPGQSATLIFRAPDKPDDYPFLCTFPGHGNAMHGTLHVLK